MTYKIVRHYMHRSNRVVKRGLTYEEARAHCANPEASSTTATLRRSVKRTLDDGPWFDGFEEDRDK